MVLRNRRPPERPPQVPSGELALLWFSVCALLLVLIATLWVGQTAHAEQLDRPAVNVADQEQLEGALILIADQEIILKNNKQISHKVKVPKETPITLNGKKVTLEELKPGLFVDVKAKKDDAGRWVAEEVKARIVK